MTKEEIIRETVEAIGNSALGDRTHWAEIIGEAIDKAQPSPVSGEMGEVFHLPLSHHEYLGHWIWYITDSYGVVLFKGLSEKQAKAICLAVNTHNSALEMLRKCEKVLKPFAEEYEEGHNAGIEDTEQMVWHKPEEPIEGVTTFATCRAAHALRSELSEHLKGEK